MNQQGLLALLLVSFLKNSVKRVIRDSWTGLFIQKMLIFSFDSKVSRVNVIPLFDSDRDFYSFFLHKKKEKTKITRRKWILSV